VNIISNKYIGYYNSPRVKNNRVIFDVRRKRREARFRTSTTLRKRLVFRLQVDGTIVPCPWHSSFGISDTNPRLSFVLTCAFGPVVWARASFPLRTDAFTRKSKWQVILSVLRMVPARPSSTTTSRAEWTFCGSLLIAISDVKLRKYTPKGRIFGKFSFLIHIQTIWAKMNV